jgi:hypothetical protein
MTKYQAWHEEAQMMIEDENFVGEVYTWLHQGQPLKICRPSGLLDDDGCMIYEGSIIEIGEGSPPWLEIVVFEDGMFKTEEDNRFVGFHLKKNYGEGCRVVGNIYNHDKTLYGVVAKGMSE